MSQLDALKAATSLRQIAKLLDTTASGLAYVLYKIPEAQKYKEFEVAKRYGGTRTISAPVDSFAHKIVRPKADEIDFSGFRQLLLNLSLAIETHRKTHPSAGHAT